MITQTRDHERSSKKQRNKNIKQHKRLEKMESLQKGCLKINQSGRARNREPEVVSLQNDARKLYLKSQLLTKRSSSGIQHSYHEKKVTLQNDICVCLSRMWVLKTYAFCKGQNCQKPFLFIGFLNVPVVYA